MVGGLFHEFKDRQVFSHVAGGAHRNLQKEVFIHVVITGENGEEALFVQQLHCPKNNLLIPRNSSLEFLLSFDERRRIQNNQIKFSFFFLQRPKLVKNVSCLKFQLFFWDMVQFTIGFRLVDGLRLNIQTKYAATAECQMQPKSSAITKSIEDFPL